MKEPYLSTMVYGVSAVVVGALIYGGFVYQADADIKTMVNSAEVKLRMAASMPLKDKQGQPLAVRADLLRQAREHLDQVEAREPDYAPTAELRGYILYLEGRYVDAAKAYSSARGKRECTEEMSESFRINEARMWRAAGRPQDAVAALGTGVKFQEERQTQADLERLLALCESGAKAEALVLAKSLSERSAKISGLGLELGRCFEGLGDPDAAERAYEQARKENMEGAYALARLKLGQGAADKALDLLEECFKSDGGKAKGWVDNDRTLWQSVATEARFRRLMETATAASPSGR